MPFGVIGRTGPGMRQVVGFADRSTGRGTFGGEFGARHCNQWGLTFAVTRPSSLVTLGRLVYYDANASEVRISLGLRIRSWYRGESAAAGCSASVGLLPHFTLTFLLELCQLGGAELCCWRVELSITRRTSPQELCSRSRIRRVKQRDVWSPPLRLHHKSFFVDS